MKVRQFVGPFKQGETYSTGTVITDRRYTQIGITTIHQEPIVSLVTKDDKLKPALQINDNDNKIFVLNENDILEFTDLSTGQVNFKILKDLPPETTIDIGYEG